MTIHTGAREAHLYDYETTSLAAIVGERAIDDLRRIAARAEHGGVSVDLYAELLNCDPATLGAMMSLRGITSDQFADALREIVERAPVDGYLAPAPAMPAPAAPFDPTDSNGRKRADGTVRGHRNGYVIGGHDFATCSRMTYAEALERANTLLHAVDGEAELIGTDEYSWSQVVTYRPLFDGARPEGAGNSIVGAGRKRRSVVMPRAGYRDRINCPVIDHDTRRVSVAIGKNDTRADVVHYIGAWPVVPYRVIKRYRTTYRGRSIVGHGHWTGTDKVTRPTAKVTRSPRVKPIDGTRADVLAAVDELFTTEPTAVTYRLPNGTRVSLRNEPKARQFRVIVTDTNGARKMSTARTLTAVRSIVDRMI